MRRFRGESVHKVDAKGRVSIPAPFRAVLAKDGFEGLYVYPSLDAEALDSGGHALRREIEGLDEMAATIEHRKIPIKTLGREEAIKVFNEWKEKTDKTAY